jgi:hypothetical protein
LKQSWPPAAIATGGGEAQLSKARILRLGLVALGCALVWVPAAIPAAPAVVCTLAPGGTSLLPGVRHGLAAHLRQYPDLSLATTAQRAAARTLLERARATTARWKNVSAARASGFNTHLAKRAPGDDAVGYLHAEQRRYSADRHIVDVKRPESLIYATQPGTRPVLIGVMFSVPRGMRGPTPAGPIERWHSHLVCMKGDKRGLAQTAGACPRGSRLTQGSEMLHVWFTRDLRSAFAVHAPMAELCRDRLLTPAACRAGSSGHEM